MSAPATSYVHGTVTAYCNHGCRCDDCTAAQRGAVNRWRASVGPAGATHGTKSGYDIYHCRCRDCRDAKAAYARALRARRRERAL